MIALIAAASAKPITVPVDVGVGPATHSLFGPVFQDQPVHTGLAMNVYAVIDNKTIRKFRRRIPKQYRKMAMQIEELRYKPSLLIPDTLFISPKLANTNTGMYGISWTPLGLRIPFVREPFEFAISPNVRLTYFYLHSTTLDNTHFLRIGLDGKAAVEVPFSKSWRCSFGWASHVYPPQELGGKVFSWGNPEKSIWHIGQGFFKIHHRFPYRVRL